MIGNGLGPEWFPAGLRAALTAWASRRYSNLAWEEHDQSYGAGYPARWVCDRGFLRAMLSRMESATVRGIFALTVIAFLFWAAVRLLGWTRYNYAAARLRAGQDEHRSR